MTDERSVTELREVAHRWIDKGWRQGDVTIVDTLHSPDYVDHDSAGRDPGREGFKEGIRELYAAFPDFHARVEDLVVEAATGSVTIRWTAEGTHRAEFMGFSPTGRVVYFKGIEIIRVREGLIRDRWGEWDGLDLLTQLGGERYQPPS